MMGGWSTEAAMISSAVLLLAIKLFGGWLAAE
jgi:hypothetical protein